VSLTIQLPPQLIGRRLGPLGFCAQTGCDPEAREQAAQQKPYREAGCEESDVAHWSTASSKLCVGRTIGREAKPWLQVFVKPKEILGKGQGAERSPYDRL
jgi:hypothetical protein